MLKQLTSTLLLLTFALSLQAQSPELYSWVRNLTGAVGYNNIPSNVQSVSYTSTDVYVAVTCIPGYTIGPWPGQPNTPSNQNLTFKITRNPVQNTGTLTAIGNGHIGVWTNGVTIFNVSDAQSYNNAGVWNRNAYYWEGPGFDNCLGHPQQQGEYHHHVSPKCLYDATDSSRHSPIIGFSFDGYPVYGAYGYTNVNGTGGITRMRTSYVTSSATTRTNGPAVNTSYPAGCFIEDFTYQAGSGTLDARNGRFCVTPEYPNGTYAYFVTISAAQVPEFPYTFFGNYYGVVQTGNTGMNSGHNTVPGTATSYTTTAAPTISIAASDDTICSGTSVTFTATITNGGTAPAYTWLKNNLTVGTGSTYTSSALVNGDVIKCMITSNAYYLTSQTATSNSITMVVGGSITPSVSIAANPGSTICSGTNVTFTATPTNGGTTPTYQWKKGSTIVGTGNTYSSSALANGDVITCVMTSSSSCASPTTATSSPIIITVSNGLTPSVAISSNAGSSICTGTNVTFTAVPTNGGNAPVYQWKKNSNNLGTGNTYTDNALANGDAILCVMTSNSSCVSTPTATSTSITMTVANSLTPSVSIASNGNTICSGTNVTFMATPINGGNTPSYQWYVNNTAAGSNADIFSSSTLTDNDVVKVVMTSNASCASTTTATSNTIPMIVNTSVTATALIAISPSDKICDGNNAVFTATVNNGGNAPQYQWKLNGNNIGSRSLIYSTDQLSDGDIVTFELTSNANCVAQATVVSNSLPVTVYSLPAIPAISVNSNILTSSATARNQWLLGENTINGATGTTYTAMASGWYSVKVTNEKGCESTSDSVHIEMTGIDDIDNEWVLSIVPNPFSSMLQIQSNTDLEDVTIKMVDIAGKSIVNQQNINMQAGAPHQLSLNDDLPAGVYFLFVQSDNFNKVQKVVKAK